MGYQLPEQTRRNLTCAEARMVGGTRFVCICDHHVTRGTAAGRHYMVAANRVRG